MNTVIILSGPIGAGKTTVAQQLAPLLGPQTCYIEGDKFWSFIAQSKQLNKRDNFRIIMRSMTAAAIPFWKSGYNVLIDFSMPPQFLDTAKKILKSAPIDYILLRPSQSVCAERAKTRTEGVIEDYEMYKDFYELFDDLDTHSITDDKSDAHTTAKNIAYALSLGKFRIS